MNENYSQNPKLETIKNANGMSVTIMDWGATIISLNVPVKGDSNREVVLGLKDPKDWYTQACFFNATIGRFANRIANSQFTIDKTTYVLNSGSTHCPQLRCKPQLNQNYLGNPYPCQGSAKCMLRSYLTCLQV